MLELQKKLAENEKKIKSQQDLYDTVRKEKNMFFKHLIEAQDDLMDNRNLLTNNKMDIEQLKGELKTKDDIIQKYKGEIIAVKDAFKAEKKRADQVEGDKKDLIQKNIILGKDIESLRSEVEATFNDFKKLEVENKKFRSERDNICD